MTPLDPQAIATLQQVTTATLTTVLLKKGLRNLWIRGARPIRSGQPRLVGRVFTLRFVPAREDLATPASWGSPISTRAAIEAMPPGCIAVLIPTFLKPAKRTLWRTVELFLITNFCPDLTTFSPSKYSAK